MTHQITRGPAPRTRRVFEWRDIAVAGRLAMQALIAWTLPERACSWLAEELATLRARVRPGHTEALGRSFLAHVTVRSGIASSAHDAVIQMDARRWEDELQALRAWRPGGWCPRIQVRGWEHVETALVSGTGAIFWVSSTWSSSIVTKMAWCRAGQRVGHLSRRGHGALGMRGRSGLYLASRIRTGIEERYADRIVIAESGPTSALRELRARLAANRLVSISMGDAADRVVRVPYFDAVIELGTGAPRLALTTGAPLLPVCTRRDGVGRYTVDILPPLAAPIGAKRDEAIVALATAAAQVIEPFGGYVDRTRED